MKYLTNFLVFSLLLLSNSTLYAGEVRIAVAANFTSVARVLAPIFEQSSTHKTKISYGSTGKLFSQIENGAPFDIFMSADTQRPLKAITQNLAVADSEFVYAKGKLVLWSSKADLFTDAEEYLKKAKFRHLAIANPKTAPYGLAAKQVLEHLQLWNGLEGRLVRGDSANQTFQFVATENAELGLVAQSQVTAWNKSKGTLWEIPSNYYKPIEQMAVLLNRGKDNLAAQDFLAFLHSKEAIKIIKQHGYDTEKPILSTEVKRGL